MRLDMSSAFWVVCQYVDHYSINILTHISFALVARIPPPPSLLKAGKCPGKAGQVLIANKVVFAWVPFRFRLTSALLLPLLLFFFYFFIYPEAVWVSSSIDSCRTDTLPLLSLLPVPLWHTSQPWRSLAPRDLHFRLTIVRGAYVVACPASFLPPTPLWCFAHT